MPQNLEQRVPNVLKSQRHSAKRPHHHVVVVGGGGGGGGGTLITWRPPPCFCQGRRIYTVYG